MAVPIASMLLMGSCIYLTSSWNYGCYLFAFPALISPLWFVYANDIALASTSVITWFLIGALIGTFVGYRKLRKR
jgi:hypothetical protein